MADSRRAHRGFRESHGKSVENPWVLTWEPHGKAMANPWKTHGKAMGLATPPGLRPDRGSPLGDCGGAAEPRGGPQTSGRPRGWRAWIADVFKGKVGQSQKRG